MKPPPQSVLYQLHVDTKYCKFGPKVPSGPFSQCLGANNYNRSRHFSGISNIWKRYCSFLDAMMILDHLLLESSFFYLYLPLIQLIANHRGTREGPTARARNGTLVRYTASCCHITCFILLFYIYIYIGLLEPLYV